MTVSEFIIGVPDTIYHPVYGVGYLQIIESDREYKAACYRHHGNKCSIAALATTWEGVYSKFEQQLKTMHQVGHLAVAV